jgi:hypothetical protein
MLASHVSKPTPGTLGVCGVPGGRQYEELHTITKCKPDAADPGHVGRRGLTFPAKISPVYWRMPRDGHPEDDYMSLPVL